MSFTRRELFLGTGSWALSRSYPKGQYFFQTPRAALESVFLLFPPLALGVFWLWGPQPLVFCTWLDQEEPVTEI